MRRIILITGTRKGIGRYLAEYYSAKNDIVIGCSRKASEFKSDNYRHFIADLSDVNQIKKMFSDIRKDYGGIDVLINNAAINPQISPFLLVSEESLMHTFRTNYFGTFYMCKEAVKLMMKKRFGRIINLGSMAERLCVPGESVYSSSKSAVTAFTKVVAKEVYEYGITCNVIAPSAIETDLMNAVEKGSLKEVLNRNAIKEFGKFEDVSNVIDFLIKPESSAITGQVIYLGGVT